LVYLESLFAVAEEKYAAVLVLLEIFENANNPPPSILDFVDEDFLSVWKGVILLNISGCRFHRGVMAQQSANGINNLWYLNNRKYWKFSIASSPILEVLRKSSTFDLCNNSSTCLTSIATSLRKMEIFQKLNR
jgi:hypothetical protein